MLCFSAAATACESDSYDHGCGRVLHGSTCDGLLLLLLQHCFPVLLLRPTAHLPLPQCRQLML